MKSHHRRVSDNKGLDVSWPADRSLGALPSFRLMVFPSASSLNLNEAWLRLPLEPRFRQSPRLCATLSARLVVSGFACNSNLRSRGANADANVSRLALISERNLIFDRRLPVDGRQMINWQRAVQSIVCRISGISAAGRGAIRGDL